MLVVGDKEIEDSAVAVRIRTGENLGTVAIDEFIKRVNAVVTSRSLELQPSE